MYEYEIVCINKRVLVLRIVLYRNLYIDENLYNVYVRLLFESNVEL